MAKQNMYDIFLCYHLHNNDKNHPKSSYFKAMEIKNGLERKGFKCYLFAPNELGTSYQDTARYAQISKCFIFVINEGIIEKCDFLQVNEDGEHIYSLKKARCLTEIDAFIRKFKNDEEAKEKMICYCDCSSDKFSDFYIFNLHYNGVFNCAPPARKVQEVYDWAESKLGKRKEEDKEKDSSNIKLIGGLEDYIWKADGGDIVIIKYMGNESEVVIPNCVTKIGENSFYRCKILKRIKIPSSVTDIADSAFAECCNLESVNVDINNEVYESEGNCIIDKTTKKLILGCKRSVISSYVTGIAASAFEGCNGLIAIEIPSGVSSIGYAAFKGCNRLKLIKIPDKVTSIGDFAFSECETLKSVDMSSEIQSIGKNAFSYCTSLTDIWLPSGVISIGESAFSYCKSLECLLIPKSVDCIGASAFYDCNKLTLFCEAESMPKDWDSHWNWNRPVVWGYKGK